MASATQEQRDSIGHPLESSLNASARDILDAISSGFRAKVDVKGKLAELYLFRTLESLQKQGVISGLRWSDADGEPDFYLCHEARQLTLQCKNVRSGPQRCKGAESTSFRVELQKTRGGIDPKTGAKTRLYRPDEFDVVAVCLFNQTGAWDYFYAAAKDLARHRKQPDRLEVMHPIPQPATPPWYADFQEVLRLFHV